MVALVTEHSILTSVLTELSKEDLGMERVNLLSVNRENRFKVICGAVLQNKHKKENGKL